MGYKKNKDGETWDAWYSKRHPKTGKAITFRRVGLRSETEAKRIEKTLVAMVLEKIENQLIPIWSDLVMSYLKDCELRGLTGKSIYNAEKCLKAATFEKWADRKIDSITTDETSCTRRLCRQCCNSQESDSEVHSWNLQLRLGSWFT